MSKGFYETFYNYLSKFRDIERAEEFKDFLIALAEWRITQIVLVMMKEGFHDFGALTPRYFSLYTFPPEEEKREREERCNPNAWEHKYFDVYEKLYYMYKKIVLTFPKEEQNIFYMHNIPPTSLYEYLYDYFFPSENEMISEKYKGKEIIRW